jgi:hypothetical protein
MIAMPLGIQLPANVTGMPTFRWICAITGISPKRPISVAVMNLRSDAARVSGTTGNILGLMFRAFQRLEQPAFASANGFGQHGPHEFPLRPTALTLSLLVEQQR